MSQVLRQQDAAFTPGTRVEVLSRFDSSWKRGFEVDTVVPDGYLVRRLSDGATLPACFAESDLRVEQSTTYWR